MEFLNPYRESGHGNERARGTGRERDKEREKLGCGSEMPGAGAVQK